MFINFTDNILFLEKEYIEKYDIYQLNDEEFKEFKEAYKIVKKRQIGLQKAKEAYIAKKNFNEDETKKIEIEYERELKEFDEYKFDGTYELVFVRIEKVEKYDFDLYTNEEFKRNIENELLSKILPGRIKINNDFVSRLFFMYEGVGISKVNQLFSLDMSLLQNEWHWCFEVENAILGIFNQVTISNQDVWFNGYIDADSNINEIFDEKIKYFDKMKVVDLFIKEIEHDGILTVECGGIGSHEDYREVTVGFPYKETFKIESAIYFKDCFEYIFDNLFRKYTTRTLSKLNGFCWKDEYETDEQLFCDEIVSKLLRKMNFSSVRFCHGKKEYGKDFIFSETDKFGHQIHYGLQVKAGNISGKANSKVDEIIGQLDDAFSMPFEEIGSGNRYYISNFIIAISGNFTENAKDKIKDKIKKDKSGSVFFLDKEKIIQLAEKYW